MSEPKRVLGPGAKGDLPAWNPVGAAAPSTGSEPEPVVETAAPAASGVESDGDEPDATAEVPALPVEQPAPRVVSTPRPPRHRPKRR